MKVFVAGATGVLGTVVADALDPDAVAQAVASAEPEVIVHQLTALSGDFDMRHIDRFFKTTNRLRTEGTDHLLAAGRAVGARRFVAQSFAGWPAARTGGPVKDEDAPFDPDPPKQLRRMLDAIRHLEVAVTGAGWLEGVVLRYGGFYGAGTTLSGDPAAAQSVAIRKRQFPVVGDGGGIWSFIHIHDAAAATAVAVERGERGIYNVVDDEPAAVRVWMPELARTLGAKPPRRVPRWLARLVAGRETALFATSLRGASNAKAKRELGWKPRYASWRQGFAQGLG